MLPPHSLDGQVCISDEKSLSGSLLLTAGGRRLDWLPGVIDRGVGAIRPMRSRFRSKIDDRYVPKAFVGMSTSRKRQRFRRGTCEPDLPMTFTLATPVYPKNVGVSGTHGNLWERLATMINSLK
jgi:hypothetical protein